MKSGRSEMTGAQERISLCLNSPLQTWKADDECAWSLRRQYRIVLYRDVYAHSMCGLACLGIEMITITSVQNPTFALAVTVCRWMAK